RIADELAPYLTVMGYTHVLLMPVAEYTSDGSWGYEPCSYYAPTTRYGRPDDLVYFVEKMHESGIGVIFDWVAAGFAADEHGLCRFDGGVLYESGYGERSFNFAYPAVRSFLASSALFWLREYRADGLRICRGGESPESAEFFGKLCTLVHEEFPEALMITDGAAGEGFDLACDSTWAGEAMEYFGADSALRGALPEKLAKAGQNAILPIAHGDVTLGKGSLLEKMHGEYEEKFAKMRAFLAYMAAFPGGKLLFMGTEFAPFSEWSFEKPLEWFMLGYEKHAKMKQYVKELNLLLARCPELYDGGYELLETEGVLAFRRIFSDGGELIAVINFSAEKKADYTLRVPRRGFYEEIINSDNPRYGGANVRNGIIKARNIRIEGDPAAELKIDLPANGALIFERKREARLEGKFNLRK
ncbi:MAG: alpha amylase C-terminal domain-containing protein, partial [Clostridia bacterium]|nr:alpha amylase C-terminal domain-containing protein [Clostridia bacterium]